MNKAYKTGIFLFIFFASTLSFCKSSHDSRNVSSPPGKNDMEELNRYLVQKDREIIQNYIERKNLKMTESPAGLWYAVLKQGSGDFFRENDRIVVDYQCTLLDGTVCYSSEKDGRKEIVLGRSELEAGLYEGLKLLKPGAEAVFILPPFLAYGLLGDQKKIPPRSTIVYTINIVNDN